MKTRLFVLLFPVILLSACSQSGQSLPTVTGSKYEVLVVMNNVHWKGPAGRSLVALLDRSMEGLPQPEAVMDISRCNRKDFTDALKPARNILLTEISYTHVQSRIIYTHNKWAYPQSVVLVLAPNDSVFAAVIKKQGSNILNYFLKTERDRQIEFNKGNINVSAKNDIEKHFGIQIDITKGIFRATKKKDFYWISNDNAGVRQDLVIYSYPYTDKNTFTKEYILAKRDSVLKANIPGEFKGSYMGTEYKYLPPVLNEVRVNKSYCAEVRGLWKMKHGGAMGGPFVSLTRLDVINHRVITIEGFVFAPSSKKRNPMRQLEAIIYSAKLPQEIRK